MEKIKPENFLEELRKQFEQKGITSDWSIVTDHRGEIYIQKENPDGEIVRFSVNGRGGTSST